MGRQVARDLQIGGDDFVVIDKLDENKDLADHMGAPFLQGRPSEDEILKASLVTHGGAVVHPSLKA